MRHADLIRDAAVCKAMAADLNAYLLKDTLYWSLTDTGPRRRPYPQLTLGGLLLRLHHLEILQRELSPRAYEAYTYARNEAESAFESWRVRLEHKLLAESKARIQTWSFFLSDCAETPGSCADEYPMQAEGRTMICLLLSKADGVLGVDQLHGQIQGLDHHLHTLTTLTPFIWDPIFEPAYPRDPFWWLYSKPISN
jgi:hypothetical protein